MTTHIAIIIGAWAFAVATALAKNVAGWFMLFTFLTALILSYVLI